MKTNNFPPTDPFVDLDDLELCNLGMACIEDSNDWKAQAAWKHFKILRQRLKEDRLIDCINPALVRMGTAS